MYSTCDRINLFKKENFSYIIFFFSLFCVTGESRYSRSHDVKKKMSSEYISTYIYTHVGILHIKSYTQLVRSYSTVAVAAAASVLFIRFSPKLNRARNCAVRSLSPTGRVLKIRA